jgi:hypothetical protein
MIEETCAAAVNKPATDAATDAATDKGSIVERYSSLALRGIVIERYSTSLTAVGALKVFTREKLVQ